MALVFKRKPKPGNRLGLGHPQHKDTQSGTAELLVSLLPNHLKGPWSNPELRLLFVWKFTCSSCILVSLWRGHKWPCDGQHQIWGILASVLLLESWQTLFVLPYSAASVYSNDLYSYYRNSITQNRMSSPFILVFWSYANTCEFQENQQEVKCSISNRCWEP